MHWDYHTWKVQPVYFIEEVWGHYLAEKTAVKRHEHNIDNG